MSASTSCRTLFIAGCLAGSSLLVVKPSDGACDPLGPVSWNPVFTAPSGCLSTCQAGEEITFTANPYAGYDENCAPHTFNWTFTPGGQQLAGRTVSRTFTNGTYDAKVLVSNGVQSRDYSRTVVVGTTVQPPPPPPPPTPGGCGTMTSTNVFLNYNSQACSSFPLDTSCTTNQAISFSASDFGSTYNFGCASHTFNWTFDGQQKSGQSVSHMFTNDGTHNVALTISRVGQNFTIPLTLTSGGGGTVTPPPPPPPTGCGTITPNVSLFITYRNASNTCGALASECERGEQLYFSVDDFGSYDLRCANHTFQWNFADGSANVNGHDVQHAFGAAGVFPVTCVVSNGTQTVTLGQNVRIRGSEPPPPPPPPPPSCSIGPGVIVTGRVGEPYSTKLSATGFSGVVRFRVTGGDLPSGVELSTSGLIAGQPTAAGSFGFTVTATGSNSSCSATHTYVLDVLAQCGEIALSPATLPSAFLNRPYSAIVSADGGAPPYLFFTLGSVPSGLYLSGNTISGTPSALGSYAFTVTAMDMERCTVSAPYSINVSEGRCPLIAAGVNVLATFSGSKTGCDKVGKPCGIGEQITFEAMGIGYDFACGPHAFTWGFGDGAAAGGRRVTHAYSSPGTFLIRLIVTNDQQAVETTNTVRVAPSRSRAVRR